MGVTLEVDCKGDALLNRIGVAFRRWCKRKKLDIPPCTWNLHLIGRGENDDKSKYPVVDSNVKAAHMKPILFFISSVATEVGNKEPGASEKK